MINCWCSTYDGLNRTSFSIEYTSWFTTDRQSRSTHRPIFSVFSMMVIFRIVSNHSWLCLPTSLWFRLRSSRMTSSALLTVLFSSAMLLMPSLVSSCWIRLERTNKPNGTLSPCANFFISAALSVANSGCRAIYWVTACHRCLCSKGKTVLNFCLVSLLLFKSLIKLRLLTEAAGVLEFVRDSVLYNHVVATKAYYPATDTALVHRKNFHPKESSIINAQFKESTN